MYRLDTFNKKNVKMDLGVENVIIRKTINKLDTNAQKFSLFYLNNRIIYYFVHM